MIIRPPSGREDVVVITGWLDWINEVCKTIKGMTGISIRWGHKKMVAIRR